MKGQGSTEYLVILAVVLVVALIVIGLLGQFTGFSGAGLEQQSKAYWQGTQPFALQSVKITDTTIQLQMENRLATKINLTNITFDGQTINTTNVPFPVTPFAAGQVKVVYGVNNSPCTGRNPGDTYQVNKVIFTYTSGGATGLTQSGDKTLYGKCSQ